MGWFGGGDGGDYMFRSASFCRTTFFCPAAKEGKNAPLIFAYAKRIGESRGGYEALNGN